jgi:pimeloyl-ACP methyl ester carboxylesterase
MLNDGRTAQVLRLRDGRDLGYAEWGAEDGKPLMLFHGLPGSRLFAGLLDGDARRLGIRLIAPERPGIGLSTRDEHRRITDWPDDILELADWLDLGRFPVAGISGGGPYAAACAWRMPQRLTCAGLLSSVGPFQAPEATKGMMGFNRLLFGSAAKAPPVARGMVALPGLTTRLPESAMSKMAAQGPDAEILRRPEVLHGFRADLREAYRQGSGGTADDMFLASRPWRFPLGEITVKTYLWQGEADKNVPPSMGRYLASKIPDCEAEFIPGAGHLWALDNLEAIASKLIAG